MPAAPRSVLLNNTTWAALSMRDGCYPARAFAEAMAPAASLTLVDDPLRDEAPPSHLGGGPGEHR